MFVDGVFTLALIDTGAAVSIVDDKFCRSLRKVTTPIHGVTLRTANAQPVEPLAACTARITIQGVVYIIELIVLPSCSPNLIIGWDFLSRHHAIIDCARAEVELFPVLEDDCEKAAAKLLVADDTDIPPDSTVLVPLSCSSVSDATVIFAPPGLLSLRKSFPLPFAVLDIKSGSCSVPFSNPNPYPIKLFCSECVGLIEKVEPSVLIDVAEDVSPVHITALSSGCLRDIQPDATMLLNAIDDALTSTQRDQLLTVL